MGCSIKFVRLDDFIADIDYIDLSANGFSLANDGYSQVSAPLGAKSVNEVITLKLQGTSKDDLSAMTQEIDEKIKQVQWWIENQPVERYQVWLRVQLDNETYPRQAQILSIRPPERVRVFTPMEIRENYIGEYSIGIERTPFWEDVYPYPSTTGITGLNTIGGMAQLSETISGDVPSRLARLAIGPNDSSWQSDFYIGFRTNRLADPANFESVWSCADGHLFDYLSDTTATSDSSAYSGTKTVCAFTFTTGIHWRVSWFLSEVATNPNDQRGEYQILLRARMSDNTSIARARIYFSFGEETGSPAFAEPINPTYRSRVVIDGSKIYTTNWALFELGTISIPSIRVENGADLDNFAVAIDAERISGTGNLELDCIILIPSAEGFARVATGYNQLTSGDSINIYQYADSTVYSMCSGSGTITGVSTQGMIRWGLPANGVKPYVIIASQRVISGKALSVKGNIAAISYDYIPRWRTLRGNST